MPSDVKETAERISTERLEETALRVLQLIADGYTAKGDGLGEYVQVENPKYQPDNGHDPYIVLDVKALAFRHADAQEGGEVGECRYCANTGWFYGDPDLQSYCGCSFGKLREDLSAAPSNPVVSDEMVERAAKAIAENHWSEGSDFIKAVHVANTWPRHLEDARAALSVNPQSGSE